MRIIKTKKALRTIIEAEKAKGKTLALVPTMGALHEGHLSLVRRAKKLADTVVATIYVNPTQFGPNEDLKKYPRPFAEDCRLLKNEKADFLFAPETLYDADAAIKVNAGSMATVLCGANRPGHFDGVCTVVLKLFSLVKPDIALFGQKDAQQVLLLKKMVQDFDLPVKLVTVATVREKDGLALSSRNRYLSAEERAKAVSLVNSLLSVKSAFKKSETVSSSVLKKARLIGKGEWDYLEVVDPSTLKPLKELKKGALVLGAMRLGRTRLIDNLTL